jgi:muramoyltetrapeptide carboxypeptidase
MTASLARPRALRAGDAVAVVAPASPFDLSDFESGIAELRALGFAPDWHDDLFARRRYVAGTPALRAEQVHRAWQRPDVAALFGARGGYGSAQVVSSLNPGTIRKTPKAFVGYSDLTTLLTWLVCHCGIVAFHGPTVTGRLSRGESAYDRASLLGALSGLAPMGELDLPGVEVIRPGVAHGRLLGGTLSQLAAAAGTPYALTPWDDTLLVLEDVGERPYRLDRLVQQLRDSGALRRVRGVLLGTFPKCDEPGGVLTARAVLADLFDDCPGPVLYGVPTGHVEGPALTLPLGVMATLDAGRNGRLVIEEAAVVEGGE